VVRVWDAGSRFLLETQPPGDAFNEKRHLAASADCRISLGLIVPDRGGAGVIMRLPSGLTARKAPSCSQIGALIAGGRTGGG
jgi:hypothetical protein